MQQHTDAFDFSHLTHDERIDLAMALLGSVREEPMLLDKEQEDELERRLAQEKAGCITYSPWEKVMARIFPEWLYEATIGNSNITC